jgi:hypothetical protein
MDKLTVTAAKIRKRNLGGLTIGKNRVEGRGKQQPETVPSTNKKALTLSHQGSSLWN